MKPQGPRAVPEAPQPSPIEIAKNNILQQMNSVGGIANNLLQGHAKYMGVTSISEHEVDKAIEAAQMLVFKMNAVTTAELDKIDEEMAEPIEEVEAEPVN